MLEISSMWLLLSQMFSVGILSVLSECLSDSTKNRGRNSAEAHNVIWVNTKCGSFRSLLCTDVIDKNSLCVIYSDGQTIPWLPATRPVPPFNAFKLRTRVIKTGLTYIQPHSTQRCHLTYSTRGCPLPKDNHLFAVNLPKYIYNQEFFQAIDITILLGEI